MVGATPLDEERSAKIAIPSRRKYTPLTVAKLAELMTQTPTSTDKWRLVAEFLEDYRWEPIVSRAALVSEEPRSTGDERWDTFLAALAEHVTSKDDNPAPKWAHQRSLRSFWFPFNTPAARADAFVHGPAAFRRRGIFIAPQELQVA